jgi:outer membrane immunogenic protein
MRRMLLSVLAATAVGLTVSVASAADLPTKSRPYAPPAPPPFSWTGFYVGVHGGAGWGTGETTVLPFAGGIPFSLPLVSQTANGWLAGGTVGYNWQANPWLVLGLEGDWTWTNIEGTSACVGVIGISCEGKVNWMADVTGRLGVAVDRALIYVKGGVAWADTDYTFSILFPPAVSFKTSDTRVGGLFGAGVEYAFAPNWSAKIEYDYMDFGKATETFPTAGVFAPVNLQTEINQQIHVIKAGVNYRFW